MLLVAACRREPPNGRSVRILEDAKSRLLDGFRSRSGMRSMKRMAAWIEVLLFLIVLTLLTPVLGGYVAAIFERRPQLRARGVGRVRAPHLPSVPDR
jgi:hypothetical protein